MNKRRAAILGATAVTAALALFSYAFQANLLRPIPLHGEDQVIELQPGVTLRGFATELERRQIVPSARWFAAYARLFGGDGTLQSGEYLVPYGGTPLQLLARVRRGDVVLHPITFVEGWRFDRWREGLAAEPWIRHTVADLGDDEIMTRLGRPGMPAEGRFFPDTYRFVRGVTDLEVLRTAADRMDRVLREEWLARAAEVPYAAPEDALILASMVEMESGVAHDRAKIAAVFLRRLDRGLRLQSDPTVIYGLGHRFRGDLRKRDLDEDTPYNTYFHRGLPPTPICNPGRAAIHAALHPAATTSLYFVARGDGTSEFSDTLEEHNAAVRRYQIEQRAAGYRSAPGPDEPERKVETATEGKDR